MPTHVYANNNEVASKAADGKSIAAFPDVCFTPPAPPVGPLPLPYPNTGEVKDTDNGTAKVFVKDKMSGMEGDSYMSKSMGDEGATPSQGKGLLNGALQGKCCFKIWSMDVKMEGKGVPRHLDMVSHNHASEVGNDPCGTDLDAMSISQSINPQEPVELEEKEDEQKEKIHVPVVLLPGLMGSTICSKDTNRVIWDTRSSKIIFNMICFIVNIFSPVASRVYNNFTEKNTEVYKDSPENIHKHTFNRMSTFGTLYEVFFAKTKSNFDGMTSNNSSTQDAAIKSISASLSKFSQLVGESKLNATLISGKESELAKYTFDIWGGGYNWLQSNKQSARDVGAFIKNDISKYYNDNKLKCLGGSKNIQTFIVTHSLGGVVAKYLSEKPEYKSNIKGIVFGGAPTNGAAAFYFAAHTGAHYLLEKYIPRGMFRKMIVSIFANAPGCLELLPFSGSYNNPRCKRVPNDTPKKPGPNIEDLDSRCNTIDNWLHVDKNFPLPSGISDDIYAVYRDPGELGIYPRSLMNDPSQPIENPKFSRKKIILHDTRTQFEKNIDGIKLFHIEMKQIKATSNAYYLWGSSTINDCKAYGEIEMQQKNKKLRPEKISQAGDGTVALASFSSLLSELPANRCITYTEADGTTFSHMNMFKNEDVLNFTCYAIADMLLNPK